MPKRAVTEVVASASQVTLGSNLPRENVELAVKLLEVVEYFEYFWSRSSSILIFLFCRKHWDE